MSEEPTGKAGVPALVAALQSPDRTTRLDAVDLLGPWLMAPEAVEPLRALLWREQDPEVRLAVLGALEMATPSVDEVVRFSREVTAKAGEGRLADYAREAVEHAGRMRDAVAAYGAAKAPDATIFAKELRTLMESAGKKGDVERLGIASALADEPALQALRERVLARGSDESFDDYMSVSRFIPVQPAARVPQGPLTTRGGRAPRERVARRPGLLSGGRTLREPFAAPVRA